MVASTRLPWSNESRRYFNNSALVFAGAGPPFSQCSGGVLPSISLKNAKWPHATCLTCSANDRTPLTSPPLGLNEYVAWGIASAIRRNCPSVSRRVPPTLSAMSFGISPCWANTGSTRQTNTTSCVTRMIVYKPGRASTQSSALHLPIMYRTLALLVNVLVFAASGQTRITAPKEQFGFNIGDDYQLANYTQLTAYWQKLAGQSDRMKLVEIGKTAEGRTQWMAIISSPANLKNLDRCRQISRRLALAEGVSEEQARELSPNGTPPRCIHGRTPTLER